MFHLTSSTLALEAVKIANRSSKLPLNVLTMRTNSGGGVGGNTPSHSSSSSSSSSTACSSYSFTSADSSSLMPPNTKASYSLDLRTIHFTPSIPNAEMFFFGNSENNTFCCLCAEDIEPPFTQRMHISASSRASHTNHTCREVVLDHMALLGLRGYPLDRLYEVWSDVLFRHPIFPRIRALTSPLWSWEERAKALLPYLKWLREMGVLDLCLAVVSPLLAGGGGGSGNSATNTSGGSSSSSGNNNVMESYASGVNSTSSINSTGGGDSYYIRRRVAFERVEYIGDCAWGNNVASRLILLYPNEQWQYGERVYNFNCMRDAAEMNITLELLFDSLHLAELLPTRCVEHVGSGKIKADVVEAVLGELHITIWGLQPEIEDDAPFVEVNGENEASLLMLVQHCLTEMYDLLVLGYVRELSGNALPLAKSLAARNIWMETQPVLRHHKMGRQRHWFRHRAGSAAAAAVGMGYGMTHPTLSSTPRSSSSSNTGVGMPSSTSSLAASGAAVSSTTATATTSTRGAAPPTPGLFPFPSPLWSPSSTVVAPPSSFPSSTSSSPGGEVTATDGLRGKDRKEVRGTGSVPSLRPSVTLNVEAGGRGGQEEEAEHSPTSTLSASSSIATTTSPTSAVDSPFPCSSSSSPVPTGAAVASSPGVSHTLSRTPAGIPSDTATATTPVGSGGLGPGFGYPRYILPAIPGLHSTPTPYPSLMPHPLLAPWNKPPTCFPKEKDGNPSGCARSPITSGTKNNNHNKKEDDQDKKVKKVPQEEVQIARVGAHGSSSSFSSSSLSPSPPPPPCASFSARLQLTQYTYTGTDVFSAFDASFHRLGMVREDTRHLFAVLDPLYFRREVRKYQRRLVPAVKLGRVQHEGELEEGDGGGSASNSSSSVGFHEEEDRHPRGTRSSAPTTTNSTTPTSRRGGDTTGREGEHDPDEFRGDVGGEALRRGWTDDAAHRGEVFFRDPYYHLLEAPHHACLSTPSPPPSGKPAAPASLPPSISLLPEQGQGTSQEGGGVEKQKETKQEEQEEDRKSRGPFSSPAPSPPQQEGVLKGCVLMTPCRSDFLRIPPSPPSSSQQMYPALRVAALYAFPRLQEKELDGFGEDGEEDGVEAGEGGEGRPATDLAALVIRHRWRRSRWIPTGVKAPTPGAITAQHPLHPGAFAYLGVGNGKAFNIMKEKNKMTTTTTAAAEEGKKEEEDKGGKEREDSKETTPTSCPALVALEGTKDLMGDAKSGAAARPSPLEPATGEKEEAKHVKEEDGTPTDKEKSEKEEERAAPGTTALVEEKKVEENGNSGENLEREGGLHRNHMHVGESNHNSLVAASSSPGVSSPPSSSSTPGKEENEGADGVCIAASSSSGVPFHFQDQSMQEGTASTDDTKGEEEGEKKKNIEEESEQAEEEKRKIKEQEQKEEEERQEKELRAGAWAFWIQQQKEKVQRDNPYFPPRLVVPHLSSASSAGTTMDSFSPGAVVGGGALQLKRPSRLTSIGGAASNIPIFQCNVSLPSRAVK